jgi:hypothetical protein
MAGPSTRRQQEKKSTSKIFNFCSPFFPALSPLYVESDSICLHLRNNSLCNGEKVSFQKKTPMVSPGTMTNMFPEKRRGYAGGLM